MSLACSKQTQSRCLWYSCVIATTLICGSILYISYELKYTRYTSDGTKGSVSYSPISSPQGSSDPALCHQTCFSKECIHRASKLLETIDQTADPCHNFYKFACGKYVEKFSTEENAAHIRDMEVSLLYSMRDVMNNVESSMTTSGKLRTVYDSCVDYNSSDVKSVPTLMKYLKKFGLEGWPNLRDDFRFDNPSLYECLVILDSYLEFGFVTFSLSDESETPTTEDKRRLFKIYGRYPYLNDDLEKEEFSIMAQKVLNYFDVGSTEANQMMEDFKELDNKIEKLSEPSYETAKPENIESPMSNITNLNNMISNNSNELENKVHILNCTSGNSNSTEQLCEVLKYFVSYNALEDIYNPRVAIVTEISYLEGMFDIISNTTERSLANYIALRYILKNLKNLNSFFKIVSMESKNIPKNRLQRTTLIKWKDCIGWTSNFMALQFQNVYAQQKFPKEELDEIRDIVQTYVQIAVHQLSQQQWIEPERRANLTNRVMNLKHKLDNNLVQLRNNTFIDILYKNFKPTKSSFFQNVMELQLHHKRIQFHHYELIEWVYLTEPFGVNALHIPNEGIELLFGILFSPIYKQGLPKLLNLISLGEVIGHEIGHEIQRFFWQHENTEVVIDNETMSHFNIKKQCLENQFFRFEIEGTGKYVKGNETVNENQADLIGTELTQKVIERVLGQEKYTPFFLPSLNYSTLQTLYISLAQMWCVKHSASYKLENYDMDPHSPPDIRVVAMIQNAKDFSSVFHCPEGRSMNPAHKCIFLQEY